MFLLGCPGTSFTSGSGDMKTVRCVSGDYEVDSDLVGTLADMDCTRQPVYTTEVVGTCGQDSSSVLIRIGDKHCLFHYIFTLLI